MKEILTYVTGVVVCSGLFVLFYRTVLQQRTSFRTARLFLVASLACAAIIPVLEIPVWRVAPVEVPRMAQTVEPDAAALPTATATLTQSMPADRLAIALWTLYGAGIALLTVVTARRLTRIARIRKRAEIYRTGECRIAVSEEVAAPFSFLATVFIGKETPDDDVRQIVMHEASHIRHRHSQEKIVMEVLKNLLGYIPELSVGLGNSLTKKRFLMMRNKMKLTGYSPLRVAGVLPLAAGMLALFAFTSRPPEIVVTEAAEPASQYPEAPLFSADSMPTFRGGGLNDFRNWVMSRTVYPKEAVERGIQGNVVARFTVGKDGRVSAVEVLESPDPLLAGEVVRVIETSPRWAPGINDGKPVGVFRVIPIRFTLADGGDPDPVASANPIYIIDGREAGRREIDRLGPGDNIESVDAAARTVNIGTRNARSMNEPIEVGYGTVSRGGSVSSVSALNMKNAYGYSSLKEYMQSRVSGIRFVGDMLMIRGIGTIYNHEPLVVVDGVPMGSFSMVDSYLHPSNVASITVLKDAGATGIYGARGSNGVVVITTRKGSAD